MTDSGRLALDEQSFEDLDIFPTVTERINLFDLINLTRTDGGAKVLRERMRRPWNRAEDIHATQESLKYIQANRSAFDALPSAFNTGRVDAYLGEILPTVEQEGGIEFSIGALSLWFYNDRHYLSIVRGVQITLRFVTQLKTFLEQGEIDAASGEIAELLTEMKTLLSNSRLSSLPEGSFKKSIWLVLRRDQIFRLTEKSTLSRLLELIYELDALLAMSDACTNLDFNFPEILRGELSISGEDLIHPLLEDAIANPVSLNQQSRLLFLTGPNMAGKTTYIRTVATAIYLAHLGMAVPASRFAFTPAERLFSSISLSDDLASGVSYFRAEALRVKAIAKALAGGDKVIAVMDEPFKGTNVKDAFDASLAILERFAAKKDCLFVFSSHLIELSEHLKDKRNVDCRYFEADEGEGRLSFNYQIQTGISSQRLGMRVLEEEGVFELLDE